MIIYSYSLLVISQLMQLLIFAFNFAVFIFFYELESESYTVLRQTDSSCPPTRPPFHIFLSSSLPSSHHLILPFYLIHLPPSFPSFLHSFLLTFLPSFLRSYLPSFLLTFHPSFYFFLPTFLPSLWLRLAMTCHNPIPSTIRDDEVLFIEVEAVPSTVCTV